MRDGSQQTSTNSSTNEFPLNEVISLLDRLLGNERTPKGLRESWREAQHAGENSTARIFIDEGKFAACIAYLLVKNAAENQSHFHGKAYCSRFIEYLENASVTSRKLLAAQVDAAIEPEAQRKINSLYNKWSKQPQNNTSQCRNKKRRTAGIDDCLADVPSPIATLSSSSAQPPSLDYFPEEQALGYPSLDYVAEDKHVLVNASLAAAIGLFPSYLASAIRRIPDPRNENAWVAAISMTFPSPPFIDRFGCQIALEVTENKVQHIAKELFDAHLETTAGLRYFRLPSGAKILPNPKSTLRGCRYDSISPMFGLEISGAIIAGPVHQDDIKKGNDSADCVSMVISHQANDGAVIYVSLGLLEGTQIKEKLFV